MALFKHVGDYVFMDYVYWYLYYESRLLSRSVI